MKSEHKFLIGSLVVIALVLMLAVIAPRGNPTLAADGIIYVDLDATGANNGTSWTDAFTTLQLALEASVSGNQIWVAAGTYTPAYEFIPGDPRSVSFQMKNGVAIYGGFDPSVGDVAWEDRDWVANLTVLSGDLNGDDGPDFANNSENSYHVFYHPMELALDSSAILDGFTIRGGNANGLDPHKQGGGMSNSWNSSPSLTNCIFTGNWASEYGGGMYNYGSSPILTNSTFASNSAATDGGGIYNRWNSSPTLIHCTFTGNAASYNGGGMYNYYSSSPILTDCIFLGNSASEGAGMYNYYSSPLLAENTFSNNSSSHGGGMYNYNSSPTLTNCAFTGNSATNGGGLFNISSTPTLTNCAFTGNSADQGGGISNSSSSSRLTNCTFSGNSAISFGGGIQNYNSSPVLTNCTFSGNSAIEGGAFDNRGYSSPKLTNCTFAENLADSIGGAMYNSTSPSYPPPEFSNSILWGNTPDEINNYDIESKPVVTYSDIQGGYDGEGNIDADPLFVDPVNDDYHLRHDSPCIDAGTNNTPLLPEYDFEGDARILDGDGDSWAIVDMGVDEVIYIPHTPVVYYVDQEATGANNGSFWVDAFTTLQPALEAAGFGDQIWVAAGTYKPSWESFLGDPRSVSFQMKNGVAIYGGFDPSVGDVAWEDRDWVANLTVLSGDLNGDDGPDFANNSENSYHVFYHPVEIALDNTAILDGFTIQSGNADGDTRTPTGGGMYQAGASPTLSNLIFSKSSAELGGGISIWGGSPTLNRCSFVGNMAEHGGGVFNSGAETVLTDSTFSGNMAASGGAIYDQFGLLVLTNCVFTGNLADQGGAVFTGYQSSPTLTNNTFSGNSATIAGGGMYTNADPAYPLPALTNAILWGNTPDEIYNNNPYATASVTYSVVQGGYLGEGNIDADPLFVDSANDDYHLRHDSPCIDAGNNSAPYLPEYDFDGDPRVLDGDGNGIATVDMGVDETAEVPHIPGFIYVDLEAIGANDGTSWADAFTTLQPALEAAGFGDQIWVAAGTYTPTYEFIPGDPRSVSFQMKNEVAIYGGFDPSLGDIAWEDRDWVANLTVLSGDLNGDDGPDFANNVENSYHVFYHPQELALDSSAILDGFVITGGYASSGNPHNFGGGMLNIGSSPVLTNCTFTGNWAYDGGGMYNWYGSSPTLTGCMFRHNFAVWGGGGVYNADSSSPVLSNCAFMGNTAGYDGGGLFNVVNSSPVLVNCIFWGNSATSAGGGIYNINNIAPVLTNCTLVGNSASFGGGMFNYMYAYPVLTNVILWGNSVDQLAGDPATVTYSIVQGGYEGEGNLDVDPLLVDPANGDLHLLPGSPAIEVGSNYAPYLPEYDFEGDLRILDGNNDGNFIVDIGVDEFIYEIPALLEVEIEVTPSIPHNVIRLNSGSLLPVAILTTDEFDAATVNPATVLFAGAAPVRWEMDDADRDGDLDMVLYFKKQQLELDEGIQEAILTGETFDGTLIQGTDQVKVMK